MGFRRGKGEPAVHEHGMVDEALPHARDLDWRPNTQQLMIMAVLSLISFMVSLDATIIVTSLGSIVHDLNATTTQAVWIGTAYLLSSAVVMSFLASLSDIFGRPITLICSVVLFTVASILCAVAQTIGLLLAGRAIQGIGAGGIVVISLVTFTDIVPLRQRPKWWGTVQGAWALGTCVGPTMGGAVVRATWRWVFYIMLPLGAVGAVAIPFVLTSKPRTEPIGTKLRRVDWVGAALFIASATVFLMALSWGGTDFAWASPATLVPLALGLAGLVATGVWECRVATEPLLRPDLFRSVSATAIYVASALQGLLLTGQLYYVPLYFLSVRAYSPLLTGAAMLPFMVVLVPSSIVSGLFITRFHNYRAPIWAGWAICAVGCGLMCTWGATTHPAAWAAALAVAALGHGAILNAQNFASQAVAAPGHEAAAAATYTLSRHLGMALGVGIGGTTFQNVMASALAARGLPTAIAANAERFLPQLHALPASERKDQLVDAYVGGLRGVFWVYLGVSLAACCLSLLIKHCDMNKELQTEHTLSENALSRAMGVRFSSTPPAGLSSEGPVGGRALDLAAKDSGGETSSMSGASV